MGGSVVTFTLQCSEVRVPCTLMQIRRNTHINIYTYVDNILYLYLYIWKGAKNNSLFESVSNG